MRHPGEFTYRITRLPPVPVVLDFIARRPVSTTVRPTQPEHGRGFCAIRSMAQPSTASRLPGLRRGPLERRDGPGGLKQVVIEPLALTFAATIFTSAPDRKRQEAASASP